MGGLGGGTWGFNGGLDGISHDLPSGKLSHNYGKIHHFSWVIPRTNSTFSIALYVYQAGFGGIS